ncbi:uncharacterized protein LOC126469613 [Schistocerca serialis cubense]|uniref:uncharacterized protein LOC126469613 n=1 Tax=Schistocerca serialis cubense TaxID=2023355 RepID=UPI00214EBBB7|nr:uncharacterized protein LOC126469613 [Schistocerca serialis cubense]
MSMETNELQEDTYNATELKSMPHDKNVNQGVKLTDSHGVNHIVQLHSDEEQSNVDEGTSRNMPNKNIEETVQVSAFAGLLILAELATSLLPSLVAHVATGQDAVQSPHHSSIHCSPLYEDNRKSESKKKTEEKNNANIFANLLILAELAASLTHVQSPIELVEPEDITTEMSPYGNDSDLECDYVMLYEEIVETEVDTSAVNPLQSDSDSEPVEFVRSVEGTLVISITQDDSDTEFEE